MNPPFKNKATPSEDKNMPSSSEHNFPVVGIGASAGGLDAFKQLLKTISVDSGMAYVLVQHLNPAHESNLTEILAQVTNIPIQEITDEVKILPNHVYVMPSGKILTSVDGVLKLSPRDTLKTSLVIDVFFTSLAVVWESKAVGVVLSGTGSDGTHGLKMIKDHGGITIVQDESAAYGDMPQSAVNANVVDFVLPPEKIAAHLLHINNIYSVTYALGEEAELPKDDEAVFKQMLNLLQQRSGVDFTYYKQSTVRRRIGRRMALHKRGKLADYLKFLRSDKAEQDALFQDMLIPVTAFFRDPKTFESLTEKVFPFLFKNKASSPVTISKGGGEPIRFWIAGCSTGEEAYSIAICLHEFLGKKITDQKIQIFASDISERAIKKARSGIYTKGEVAGISDARLNTYFVNTDGNYQVNATIRDLCVFANQNFLKDPPFAKMDMISCRNVLIYMNAFLQKKALTTFHYALKENGIMLLGKSETASAASQLFSPFDNHDKIYSRKSGTGRYMQVATGRKEETFTSKNFEAIRETPQADFLKRANAILMAKSPASVIVNEQTDIVHIHGDLTPYLQTPQGRPTHNLLRMAREGLAFELRSILHKSKTGNSLVIKEGILVKTGTRLNDEVGQGKQSLVTIEVIPLTDTVEPHFLILFTKIPSPDVEEKSNASSSGKKVKNEVALQRIEQLEKEVAQARHDLRSVTEDMDTANEELQSANEELQSSNEEMQSLNEELQTSKEELQSTVEELIIVNQELVDSVSEQARARKTIEISEAKFRNLILQAPVLISTFKGPSFIIETVNKIALEIWGKTHEQVINKPLFEVSPELEDGLNTILNNVYTTGEPFISNEINVQLKRTGKPNTAYFSSVYQPLRDLDNKICGIILIGTEVTESVNARRLIEASEQRLSDERQVLYNSFMNAPAGIAIYKGDTHIYEFANVEHEKTARRKITIGKTVQELFPELEQQGLMAMLNNVFLTGEPFIANELPIELKIEGNDKLVLGYYNLVVQPLVDAKGNTERLLSHAVDVTQQVEARKLTEASEQRFGAAVEAVQGILWSNNAKGEMEGEQKGWAALTGQSYQEYQGYGWAKAVHPDDAQPTIDAWNEAVREFKTFEFEHRVKTKSGKWDLFSIKAIPLLNEDGSIREWIGVHTNITEQKEAEEKLKESEARFRTLTETIPIMVWTATPDGKKNFFNKYFLEYTGSTFEEAKGDGWQRNILPGDLEKELEIWRNSLKTGEDFKIEKRIRSHYGTYRWHLSHSMAQKDIAGKIIGWIGTNTDITEQKSFTEELEKKVKERTEQLQLQNQTFELAESIAQFGSYTWSIATGALEYSDNLFRLLDCEPQEFVPSFEKFLSFVHPDDLQQVISNGEQTMITGELVETPYRIISKTGITKYVRSSGRFSGEGVHRLLIGTVRDITKDVVAAEALVEKEDYLNQIINNAPDAVIVINEKDIITLWNPKTEEIFGWKAEEVLGLNLSDIIIPMRYREGHREGMKRLLKTGESRILNKTLELAALNKEGKEFPISLTVSQAVQHGVKLFISFIRDITLEKHNKEELLVKAQQLVEMNQSLEFNNKQLENTNAELASFSYIASHDLKEPLRKIQAFSRRIIEGEKFSDKTQDYFNRIIAAGERMQNLIDSLLDLSSVNSSVLIFVSCDLNTIIEESKSDLQIRISEKQAIIEHENLPTIKGVCVQISQLITNLIDNAIKYSRQEIKPHIKITAARIHGNEIENPLANIQLEYHAIKIADNGIGFEKEYANKIFELFQRLHGKNEYSGTGIGLSIVKKIVTNHNGFIIAEGKPNVGSTFTIYLPTS